MAETLRIADQLQRAHSGDAWHGFALEELLADVSAAEAAARPISGVLSIWEIVLHVAGWESVTRRRMGGERVVDLDPAEDWPPLPKSEEIGLEEAWEKARAGLRVQSQGLLRALAESEDAQLSERVPGHEYTFYELLHGVIQHGLYHAGQIAILKKTLRTDTSKEDGR